jgi:DNA topoisomerase VI subunit B
LEIVEYEEVRNAVETVAKRTIKQYLTKKQGKKPSQKQIDEFFEDRKEIFYEQAFQQVFSKFIKRKHKEVKERNKSMVIDFKFIGWPEDLKDIAFDVLDKIVKQN